MSSLSPSASSPPRHREGAWENRFPSQYYDYDAPSPAYRRGPPPPQPSVPPNRSYPQPAYRSGRYHNEFWSYEPPWGSPSPYEGYHGPDRRVQAPPRISPQHQRSPRPYQLPFDEHHRIPTSPHTSFPGYASAKKKRFQPQDRMKHEESDEQGKGKKTGDPLSILANVSAGMTGKDGQDNHVAESHLRGKRQQVPIPAPTSPLQRRTRPSPSTPSQASPPTHHLSKRHQVTPTSTNTRASRQEGTWEQPAHGRYDYSAQAYYSPHPRSYPSYSDYPANTQDDGSTPALVERGSFDSQGDCGPYREGPYHSPGPPMANSFDEYPRGYGYWDPPQSAYPPPRWNYKPFPGATHPDYYKNEEVFPYYQGQAPIAAHNAPYTFVQQPRLEEKTILRKKFSWKHYPELERFLIANRDEYLKHSSMNYTAEQKQYNNWLTERLIEVAAQHNYAFDSEDFNFVAIRDRIRCYYKSYVQTARKRGLKLPDKK